jgi:hypothetical protein
MVNVPFSYQTYATYAQCTSAPENNQDSSVMMGGLPPFVRPSPNQPGFYLDADRGRCQPSALSSAPFGSLAQCENALKQCNSSGQPTIQFSNPVQAVDAHWTEPYLGFRSNSNRNQTLLMTPPQIPLNAVGRPAAVGIAQLTPGLAGQGYSILG